MLTDDLRDKVIESGSRAELGSNSLVATGRERFFYVGTPGMIPIVIDARKIGPFLGKQLAKERVFQAGPPTRVDLELTRPDVRARVGRIVKLDTDAPGGLTGTYMATAVDYTGSFPDSGATTPARTMSILGRRTEVPSKRSAMRRQTAR